MAQRMRNFLAGVTFSAVFFSAAVSVPAQARAEVLVLSTLHQFHSTVRGYSFEDLTKIVEGLKPDILAVELTPKDLESRVGQKTKLEYQKSIFPLIDKRKYQTVPLEPSEPLYSELVGLLRDSNNEIKEKFPSKAEAFSIYSDSLYSYLFGIWDSPEAVNSSETDGQFKVKHAYQNALFGSKEEKVWSEWNTLFLEQILKTAQENKGKRILVLVGVEHAYWLREHLRAESSIDHREPATFLGKSKINKR